MFRRLRDYLRKHTTYGKTRYLHFLYSYDEKRYYAHSSMDRSDGGAIAARIRLLIHALEKGLSLARIKPEFGKEKVMELLHLIRLYEGLDYQPDEQVLELARGMIRSYVAHRERQGEDVSFVPEEVMKGRVQFPVGAVPYERQTLTLFETIARNRHSVREFAEGPVNLDIIRKAVALAQTAPSACNRQSSHVFVCSSPGKIRKIMERHGGTRGFTTPGVIIALTGDLSLYQSEFERNTVFVDGGIFLMNLLYALDRYDLAACPVIWGAEPDNDGFLYDLIGIPVSHEIVSLVLVGNYPDHPVKIPCSARREVDAILHFTDKK